MPSTTGMSTRACNKSRTCSEYTMSGEPSSVQISAYASADFLGRVFKMMPRTSSVRNTLGKSTTRGSMRNSSKYVRTSSLVGLSGEPRLMRNIPCFMCFS